MWRSERTTYMKKISAQSDADKASCASRQHKIPSRDHGLRQAAIDRRKDRQTDRQTVVPA